MQPLTLEWVAKAEGDFSTAGRELRARKAPNYDAACFHAQQCFETGCSNYTRFWRSLHATLTSSTFPTSTLCYTAYHTYLA